jgi:hypothetical protein
MNDSLNYKYGVVNSLAKVVPSDEIMKSLITHFEATGYIELARKTRGKMVFSPSIDFRIIKSKSRELNVFEDKDINSYDNLFGYYSNIIKNIVNRLVADVIHLHLKNNQNFIDHINKRGSDDLNTLIRTVSIISLEQMRDDEDINKYKERDNLFTLKLLI